MKFNEGGVVPAGSLTAGDTGEVAAYSNRNFGLNLMFARKKAGMTQEKLAEVTKIDKNSIARYETGYGMPTAIARRSACYDAQVLRLPGSLEMGGPDGCTNSDCALRPAVGGHRNHRPGASEEGVTNGV